VPLIAELEQNSFRTIYATFTELFTKWFNVLLEDKLLQVSVSEDFSPIITQNGYQIPLEYLSGGEKQTVALAYRLALNQALNDLYDSVQTKDLLILDEPTDGFSTEQLDRIKIVLEQLKLKQLIIVSHEPKIETFVQHIIRLRKENHITQVQYL
jgi:exonuclease SbcC